MFLEVVVVQDMPAMNTTIDLAVQINLTLSQATPHDIQELDVSMAGIKRDSISWNLTYYNVIVLFCQYNLCSLFSIFSNWQLGMRVYTQKIINNEVRLVNSATMQNMSRIQWSHITEFIRKLDFSW